MTYFSKFPYINYELNGNTSLVKDILVRCAFMSEYKPYTDLYSKITIDDGESVQSLANRVYGASTYHWVILMFNELHNPYYEWPMSQDELESYVLNKYGQWAYTVKQYEQNGDVVGDTKEFYSIDTWVPPDSVDLSNYGLGMTLGENLGGAVGMQSYDSVPVTFFEYEERINDARRNIHILRPELLSEFVSQFEKALNG